MLWGFHVSYIIGSEACHFGLSAVVGWLAYWSTSTILSRSGLRAILPGWRISLSLLLVSLSCAVLAHVVEDYTIDWF